jgi:RNA polymerase sigma factor (sigma-70 family)
MDRGVVFTKSSRSGACKKTALSGDIKVVMTESSERRMPDWDEILGRDGPTAWRTAWRLVGNRADADECFQEACLAALEVARCEEVRNWRALLQRLATARALDKLRRRRQRPFEPVANWEAVRGPAPLPSQEIEDAELSARLRAALADIPPKQAEAFCLHSLDDWNYAEIAQHLGASVDAVGVLLHRARARLRRLLEDGPGSAADAGQVTPDRRKEPR